MSAKPLKVQNEVLIKNGYVYDPLNGVKGDVKDIAIQNGKIVEPSKLSTKAKVIDAKGKVVMPGGVDIHTHVAGPKVNVGRMYRPEDKLHDTMEHRTDLLRAGGGFSVPSTFVTAYRYAKLGYTFVNEAAMPPLLARHTHEEMHDTPILDQSAFTLLGNNWLVMEYIKKGQKDNLDAFIAWMLKATKGSVIKIVNPGGTEAWGWGKNCTDIDDPVPYFEVTPKNIIQGLCDANERLGLPHSIHLHGNNLGHPGNYTTTLKTLALTEGIKTNKKSGRNQNLHFTHAQFNSYGGTAWKDFESKADQIANYVNTHDHLTIDVGFVTLDETTTMTADGPFEYVLHSTNHLKWANLDVELETGSGVVPFIYDSRNHVFGIQWATGLELGLLVKDPMKCFLTTDHPNAGPFTRYPVVASWLMSKKARDAKLATLHKWVGERTKLKDISREMTLYELAQMTRAGPAKALGMSRNKGHLGIGADGDVSIYDLDPKTTDIGQQPEVLVKALEGAAYTIKGGDIVVKDGEVVSVDAPKYTIWSDADGFNNKEVMNDIVEKFLKYYSVTLNNYPVQDVYAPHQQVIKAGPLAGGN
ncbi:tungsten-dependent formylmethanofuran dehydrogenase subunit FwdA [Methanocella arvoryzae]|uniref:Tungsten formylmethanofuran dehydrogenase,subunit A n=1 Tax=Methanocella arvoryzae (strain DSM 22066 / NBRC 105507 / MRE50) TaxID=351160 RepID=Q0W0U2_METAR|nr:tungsten-dependent formylmethanofuran dehydrogenase subunit FwdA [Methanocella arvoryzae]CAJ38001.1 tungsten formylmethanofuran dehydrogenase,subunit A [Methanocella arvoryzae MRE50]